MSVRELLEAECGAENSLVRLGSHVGRDTAFKDEGFSGAHNAATGFRQQPDILNEQQLVNDFFREFSGPPQVIETLIEKFSFLILYFYFTICIYFLFQTFNMKELLNEIRQVEPLPSQQPFDTWSAEYVTQNPPSLHQVYDQ